jgi:hypothetical protein
MFFGRWLPKNTAFTKAIRNGPMRGTSASMRSPMVAFLCKKGL